MLEHAAIERLIPHAGAMVLLDRVLSVDEDEIVCETMSHRRDDNPLLCDGCLPAVCGAEYGAQAAAVHGPALKGAPVRPGMVVLLRDLSWARPDLSVLAGPLEVRARLLHHGRRQLAYGFSLHAAGAEVMGGECGIILL